MLRLAEVRRVRLWDERYKSSYCSGGEVWGEEGLNIGYSVMVFIKSNSVMVYHSKYREYYRLSNLDYID